MADVDCPVCSKRFKANEINTHVNICLNTSENVEKTKRGVSESDKTVNPDCQPLKRQRTAEENRGHSSPACEIGHKGGKGNSKLAKAWSFMRSPSKPTKGSSNKSDEADPTRSNGSSNSSTGVALNTKTLKPPGVSLQHEKTPASSVPGFASEKFEINNDGNNNAAIKSSLPSASKNESTKTRGALHRKGDGLPLPERMRPSSFDEYMGQSKVLGKNKLLRTLLESDRVPNIILWGPPGCGKTTLARIIAARCKETHNSKFVCLSATSAGVADVKEIVRVAKNDMKMFRRRTILFVDEIHRFNKTQQDAFLPHVEDGTITLLGATTENPSFQVNNALMSRCRVIVLEKLGSDDVQKILKKALDHLDVAVVKSSGDTTPEGESIGGIEEEAVLMLANLCDGDARAALNCLQLAVESCLLASESGSRTITSEHIKETLQRSHVQYDRTGEEHYNCASALQKSIRGSSDNGAVYWLSRMLEGGEDPLFIARRLVVTASEDIGLADPQALPLAIATFQACTMIGMPECAINLAHCTTYLARATKSNESYKAMHKARESIKNHQGPLPGVPLHLRNASTKLMKDLGYGKNYKYSHDHPGDTSQEYLPKELNGVNFFR